MSQEQTDKKTTRNSSFSLLVAFIFLLLACLFFFTFYLQQRQQVIFSVQQDIEQTLAYQSQMITELKQLSHKQRTQIDSLIAEKAQIPDLPVEQTEWLLSVAQVDYTANGVANYTHAALQLQALKTKVERSTLSQAKAFLKELDSVQAQLHHVEAYSQSKQKAMLQLQELSGLTDQLLQSVSIDFYQQMNDAGDQADTTLVSLSQSWEDNWQSILTRLSVAYELDHNVRPNITSQSDLEKNLFLWHIKHQLATLKSALSNQQSEGYHNGLKYLASELKQHLSNSRRLNHYIAILDQLDQFTFEPMTIDLLPLVSSLRTNAASGEHVNQQYDES